MYRQKIGLLVLLVAVAISAAAQIDTDRPAFTNTVGIVPHKTVQLEVGMEYFNQKNNITPVIIPTTPYTIRLEEVTLPFGILRFGLSAQTEFRFELPVASSIRGSFYNDSTSKFVIQPWNRELGIGLKHKLIDNEKFKLSNLVTLRSQRDYFVSSERDATFNLSNDVLWQYNSSERSKFAGTLGFANGKDAYSLNGAVLVGRTFGDHLWIQTELVRQFAFLENRKSNFRSTTFNLSSQYTLSNQDAIDATVGTIPFSNGLRSSNLVIQIGYAHLFKSKS